MIRPQSASRRRCRDANSAMSSAPARASTWNCASNVAALTGSLPRSNRSATCGTNVSLRQPLALCTSTDTGPSARSTSSNSRGGRVRIGEIHLEGVGLHPGGLDRRDRGLRTLPPGTRILGRSAGFVVVVFSPQVRDGDVDATLGQGDGDGSTDPVVRTRDQRDTTSRHERSRKVSSRRRRRRTSGAGGGCDTRTRRRSTARSRR